MPTEPDVWRERGEMERARRRDALAAAQREFTATASLAQSGDMVLLSPATAHWTLTRLRGRTVVAQFWPSAEKVQVQGDRKSRPCTLAQFQAILRDKFGCVGV